MNVFKSWSFCVLFVQRKSSKATGALSEAFCLIRIPLKRPSERKRQKQLTKTFQFSQSQTGRLNEPCSWSVGSEHADEFAISGFLFDAPL